jgi:hypothetical protein
VTEMSDDTECDVPKIRTCFGFPEEEFQCANPFLAFVFGLRKPHYAQHTVRTGNPLVAFGSDSTVTAHQRGRPVHLRQRKDPTYPGSPAACPPRASVFVAC